jgi:hypothetical protein
LTSNLQSKYDCAHAGKPTIRAPVLRSIKSAAAGYSGLNAAELIVKAAVHHLGGEITVLDASGFHELFRIGAEGHGGVHIHDPYIQHGTWKLKPANEAHLLNGKEDYNY